MPSARSALHAADAEHKLLANARAMVAAVQTAGQLAIFRTAFLDVAIEQIQLHAADLHQPHLGEQRTGPRVDSDSDRAAIGARRADIIGTFSTFVSRYSSC